MNFWMDDWGNIIKKRTCKRVVVCEGLSWLILKRIFYSLQKIKEATGQTKLNWPQEIEMELHKQEINLE